MVFDIQRFSTHDGPGIRTVVFLKGCPLRCPWCENPESQSPTPEILYDAATCIGCLDCVHAASNGEIEAHDVALPTHERVTRPTIHRERIRAYDDLRRVCPSQSLTVVGREMSVAEIMDEVVKDLPFYGREGGVTFSGGEPLAQPSLLGGLIDAAHARSIDVAVETSLQVPWRVIEPFAHMVSLFLADLKHLDPGRYRETVGGDLSVVLENFRRLEELAAPVVVRVPVIPGFNDSPAVVEDILRFAGSLSNVTHVHLLPYHSMGKGKYELLGREYAMADVPALPPEALERYRVHAGACGLCMTIGG